jgi:hypothetical protein
VVAVRETATTGKIVTVYERHPSPKARDLSFSHIVAHNEQYALPRLQSSVEHLVERKHTGRTFPGSRIAFACLYGEVSRQILSEPF